MNIRTIIVVGAIGTACSSSSPVVSDAGDSAVQADAGGCCKEDVNASLTPATATLINAWTAWQYTPTCSFAARRLQLPSNGPAIALLQDMGGGPGAILLPETSTSPIAAGNVQATFSSVPIAAGQPIWIALKNAMPGTLTGSSSPFGTAGQSARSASSDTLAGPWNQAPVMEYPIYSISGCAP